MGIDVVKRVSRQKLFANMLHEFTTVAEGIHFPTEPTLKKARLEMAIRAIDRIKEKDLNGTSFSKSTDCSIVAGRSVKSTCQFTGNKFAEVYA